jgi:hypothetical protein
MLDIFILIKDQNKYNNSNIFKFICQILRRRKNSIINIDSFKANHIK